MVNKKITDYDILKKHYTFLNDQNDESWESNLVSKYHETLFKEYVVCDLSRYKTGDVALRWRSAKEVVDGKCENICSNISCQETTNLSNFEVLFNYVEHDIKKQALVKVRVCPDCSYMLNYKNRKKTKDLSYDFQDSITQIHKKFQLMENDLSLVEEKVKNELGCVYDIDIFDIFSSFHNTRNKINKLNESFKEIYSYKKQVVQLIKSQIRVLESLSELEDVKATVNNDFFELAKNIVNICNSYFQTEDVDLSISFKSTKVVEKKEEEKKTIEFIPIDDNKFNAVPNLVKRRATLQQINELLKYLHNHAVKHNKCIPVRINDIANEGIKLYGQTGAAKIAILRHLKLIQVINRDNTILLLDPRFKGNKIKRKF